MKIMSCQPQNFCASTEYHAVKNNRDTFYELSTDEKLNVIFDTLNSNGKKITQNQSKIQDYNSNALKTIFSSISRDKKLDSLQSAERLCQLNTIA